MRDVVSALEPDAQPPADRPPAELAAFLGGSLDHFVVGHR